MYRTGWIVDMTFECMLIKFIWWRFLVLSLQANQVVQMFPGMSYNAVLNDLRHTRSVELTVGNIVDGRLVSLRPLLFVRIPHYIINMTIWTRNGSEDNNINNNECYYIAHLFHYVLMRFTYWSLELTRFPHIHGAWQAEISAIPQVSVTGPQLAPG